MDGVDPNTGIESNNFYFLVKECGISPLDIPHMTELQISVLIDQHNSHVKKEEESLEKLSSKHSRR